LRPRILRIGLVTVKLQALVFQAITPLFE